MGSHDYRQDWDYLKIPHSDPTPLEGRLGEIASLVAGRPVEVRCEEFSPGTIQEPGGIVQFNGDAPADYTRIRPDVCTAILRFIRAPDVPRLDSVVALKVLAHESFHVRGIKVEVVAECYAMQAVARVARALGGSEPYAHELAGAVYGLTYADMPPLYPSPDCRPGGPLDQHPGGGWPD